MSDERRSDHLHTGVPGLAPWGGQRDIGLRRGIGIGWNIDAVESAYDVTSDASAKCLGTQLMREVDVGIAIHDLLAQVGIPKHRQVQRLRDLIESNDLTAVGRALDMSWKLDGSFSPEKFAIQASNIVLHQTAATIKERDRKRREEKELRSTNDPEFCQP